MTARRPLTGKRLWALFLFAPAMSLAAAQPSGTQTASVEVARWPQDHRAAISLTFDDAMNSQLDVVAPILKRHHLTATFFVSTGGDVWQRRKAEWRRLADEGNELANHTVHHPCLLEAIEPHSQSYTPEMMEAEIRDAAQEISKLLPRPRGLTFAYPCGDTSFGPPAKQVEDAALYMHFVSQYAFGARGFNNEGAGGAQDPDDLNVLNLNQLGPTAGKDFVGLLAMAEPAIQGGHWGVYCFHGVGGEWLSVTSDALEELADYLARHSEIWTATFGDVLRYTQERKAARITIDDSGENTIHIALDWPMDATIYDLPLTLKIAMPAGWMNATLSAEGKVLHPTIIVHKDRTIALVDVPPQTKHLRMDRLENKATIR